MKQQGFTLIELTIVVAIVAILAAIAYPNYQDYTRKTKRVEMMTELQSIARDIEAQKIANNSYRNISQTTWEGRYPRNSTALYNVAISDLSIGTWKITATPISNTLQDGDGQLSLNFEGTKCRNTQCGKNDEWNQ